MGEGAGVLVLRRWSMHRPAKQTFVEIAGYAATCDAYHMRRDPEGKH